MISIQRRLVALLVGLALILPGIAFGRFHYFCRMTGRVMDAPCCETDRSTERLEDSTGVQRREEARAPDCCVRLKAACTGVASSAPLSATVIPVAALVAVLATPVFTSTVASAIQARFGHARGPPPAGPPLFVAHCSLLI